jgi:hypothetical protein
LPPFLLGVSAAVVAEVAVGLLLYGGPGFMRSLTAILAVEAAALGMGFLASGGGEPEGVDGLRRRWLFCLVAFLAAVLFSALWSAVDVLGASPLGQGLGLALLAALPLYAAGGVLGAMGPACGPSSQSRLSSVGGPTALGAAFGFAVTGASLPQVVTPASLLLVCLVLLSGGGLVFGSVLDSRLHVHVRARRPSGLGDVCIEDRHLVSQGRAARVLLEGAWVRRWSTLSSDGSEPWDVEAFRGLGGGVGHPSRLLMVGGGCSSLPGIAARAVKTLRVDVVERSHAVVELGREHMETGLHASEDGRVVVRTGNTDDALDGLGAPYQLVLVDSAALAPVGGTAALSRHGMRALAGAVAADGALAVGPVRPEAGTWSFPEGWSHVRYCRRLPEGLSGLDLPLVEDEEILVGTPVRDPIWPDPMGSFRQVKGSAP